MIVPWLKTGPIGVAALVLGCSMVCTDMTGGVGGWQTGGGVFKFGLDGGFNTNFLGRRACNKSNCEIAFIIEHFT
jgi:hypothetical protein